MKILYKRDMNKFMKRFQVSYRKKNLFIRSPFFFKSKSSWLCIYYILWLTHHFAPANPYKDFVCLQCVCQSPQSKPNFEFGVLVWIRHQLIWQLFSFLQYYLVHTIFQKLQVFLDNFHLHWQSLNCFFRSKNNGCLVSCTGDRKQGTMKLKILWTCTRPVNLHPFLFWKHGLVCDPVKKGPNYGLQKAGCKNTGSLLFKKRRVCFFSFWITMAMFFCTLLFATHILDLFFNVPDPKKISGRPDELSIVCTDWLGDYAPASVQKCSNLCQYIFQVLCCNFC